MSFKNAPTPHCHPSSLDSASTPEAFAEKELELGTGTLTVTDHGSLAACYKVYELAKKKGLTPIIGLEGYMRDDNDPILVAAGIPKNDKGSYIDYVKYHHVTMHFQDYQAYNTAVRLLSKAPVEKHGSEYKPLFNWANLEEIGATNTIVGSSCLIGMVARHLMQNNDGAMAIKYYERLRGVFKPGNFIVEVFPHVCDRNWDSAVYVTVKKGEGVERLRCYKTTNLRTNVGEIKAEVLAKAWGREGHGKHTILIGRMEQRKWVDYEPMAIQDVELIEDFVVNECRPWAPNGDLQKGANEFILYLAKKYGDPIISSCDSHMAHPKDKVIQDVRLAQSGNWRFATSYHRKSSDEAYEYFKNVMGISEKEFEGWIDNSYAWADKLKGFKFETRSSLPTKFYPQDTLKHTMELIKKHGRMDWSDAVMVSRLDQEINLFHKNGVMDFLPYFFVYEDVCEYYTKHKKITGVARGSGGGVLLSYLLGITHLDPLRYKLSLNRFMTLDRIKSGNWPDLDQDLPERDELLSHPEKGWLNQRFGDHYAQISADTTLKLRSAVKDTARMKLGKVPFEIEQLTKDFEQPPQGLEDYKFVFGYEDAGNQVQGSIERDKALQTYIKAYPSHWEIVKECLGLGRGKTRHASAFLIADCPIWEWIPLMNINGVTCTQYTAKSVEAVGGIKFDFLVVSCLNDIGHAIQLIQKRSGMNIPESLTINKRRVPEARLLPFKGKLHDIWDLPIDQDVFATITNGQTETVFHFNTPAAQQGLENFAFRKDDGHWGIDSIEAMAAFTALDRPGPLNAYVTDPTTGKPHNMLVEYARRVRGEKPVVSLQEWEDLFPDTYGVCVFQESLESAYRQLMGCSGSEAEQFRSDVSKKNKNKIIAAYPKFMEVVGNKYGKTKADEIWALIGVWSSYGLNLSHATAYGATAYACAFLKYHYPLEWWTAVLTNATKNEINEKLWRHCGKFINLPDVTLSKHNFEIEGTGIRAPLSLLHGVGEGAHNELLKVFTTDPPKDILGFCQRVMESRKAGATQELVIEEKSKKNRKTGEVTIVKTEKLKVNLAHSSLHRGVVYTLIISGAMESLFPPGPTILEQLSAYEQALAAVSGKKAEPVNPKYHSVNQLVRHQMRKKVLPAYSTKLLPLMIERKVDCIKIINSKPYYIWKSNHLPIIGISDVEILDQVNPLPDNGIRVAITGYIESTRRFKYGGDKEAGLAPDKEAIEIVMDVDGSRIKYVKWPDRNTGALANKFKADLVGALVVGVINKYRENKPFSLDDIEAVQPPIQEE